MPSATGTTGSSSAVPGGATSASAGTSYRLSGSDMTPWAGQRVQVIGTIAPVANASSSASATPGAPAIREFKVQSVQPASGPCPQP